MSKKQNTEEKRRIVLDSINFYKTERNKALFQVNDANTELREIKEKKKLALQRAKHLKVKMFEEVNRNLDILKKTDIDGFKFKKEDETE